MKKCVLLFLICVCGGNLSAHKPNQAFFRISEKSGLVEITAELPWSARNALLAFNPSLENSRNQEDYDHTFKKYITENLILRNASGEMLDFKAFHKLPNKGHSHQNKYLLVFEGNELSSITNTFLFNIYENQVNYHMMKIDSKPMILKTNKMKDVVNLTVHPSKIDHYYLLLSIPILLGMSVFISKSTLLYRMKEMLIRVS